MGEDGFRFVVRGYHGTSRDVAQRVLVDGRFEMGPDGRFGAGVYFFEENAERAWNWAHMRHGSDPAVVVAQLDLTDDGLDLTQKAGRALVLDVLNTIDVSAIEARVWDKKREGYVDAVALELLDPDGDLRWIRVLVFDTERAYEEPSSGPATVRLRRPLSERGLRTRIVRNVQCHVVVRHADVITALRRHEET